MNIALWPATLGYFMDTMMSPAFDVETIDQAQWFFSHLVSGRGAIPAVRIGDQPYGILPTTSFSTLRWPHGDPSGELHGTRPYPSGRSAFHSFIPRLQELIRMVEEDWAELTEEAAYVDRPGSDPHQLLINIVGLHPSSVEFHQRQAKGFSQLFNSVLLDSVSSAHALWSYALQQIAAGMNQIISLGYSGEEVPDVLKKFLVSHSKLLEDLIDDQPLSESEPIRDYLPGGGNYLRWLINASVDSLESIRRQRGFIGEQPPTALLYLLLRHALLLGYWDASIRLHLKAQIMTDDAVWRVRREPGFIHIDPDAAVSESRWHYLYRSESQITGDANMLVADFIAGSLFRNLPEAVLLESQIDALGRLENTSTGALERAFTEHVDCASYRLDAWKLGLVHYKLGTMRFGEIRDGNARQGLYLGMYGWLEDVKPEGKELMPVELSDEMARTFDDSETSSLVRDSENAGYILTPSLNQAVSAAILRNAHKEAGSKESSQANAVNLSSSRVRLALSILEGIRGGQSLGALLGYRFERGLHDSHDVAEVDQFIYDFRRVFPLVTNRTEDMEIPASTPIEAIEARNVVDGYKLVKHIHATDRREYPFGLAAALPSSPTAGQKQAINAEVEELLSLYDAVADLAMAEAVHQVAQGNYGRAGATLDAYGKSSFPPLPDVIQTPRSGFGITHRVALHFEPGLDGSTSPVPGLEMTPRAMAEPALNAWLAKVLPDPRQVVCSVSYRSSISRELEGQTVSQFELGLQPLDLLYMLRTETEQAMTALDDCILQHVIVTHQPEEDQAVSIRYTERVQDSVTFFELSALIRSLRALLLGSRSVRPSDVTLQHDRGSQAEQSFIFDEQRVKRARDGLRDLKNDLETFRSDLPNADDVSTAIRDIDKWIEDFAALQRRAIDYGTPEAGLGFVYDWKTRRHEELRGKLAELIGRWEERLGRFDELKDTLESLPSTSPDSAKRELLTRMEGLVSTELSIPPPETITQHIQAVNDKEDDFRAKLGQLEAIKDSPATSLSSLISQTRDELPPISKFDMTRFELEQDLEELMRFAQDLAARAASVSSDLDLRIEAVTRLLDGVAPDVDAESRFETILQSGKEIFGDEFQMVPEFRLDPDQTGEWKNALSADRSLLAFQTNDQGISFPVDEWLYGVARVRDKLHHLENTIFLSEALGGNAPVLQPCQFPYQVGDHWLALRFPRDYELDGERLLYTAHHEHEPFTSQQCGVLIDEWSEVIPTEEEVAGVAFHYDRPSSEPPQSILLVAPPSGVTGKWSWRDLVQALPETLDLAKLRAIEPDQVGDTDYARLLPATWTAITYPHISIGVDLASNQRSYRLKLEEVRFDVE